MFKKIDKFKMTYIIFGIIILLFFINRISNSSVGKGVIIGLSFVFLIVLSLGYLLIDKCKKIKIETLFLIFSISFGIFYIFGFPPSQLPDDSSDYFRALEVSEFHLTTPKKGKAYGREYSVNVGKVYESKNYSDVFKIKNLKLDGDKRLYTYTNKSLYSFVCYLPQAIGVGLGRIFNLPIIFQIILGKIFNFAAYLLAIYLSIRYIPLKKELIFFISLFPISMQEATSMSADCMTIWSTIALISFIVWARVSKKVFTKKHYFTLSTLLLCVSLSKIVYLPLCFLIILIPQICFATKKKKIIYCSLILFVSILVNLIWLKISAPYLDAFMYYRKSNSSEQLKYIITNPLNYIIVLFNTIDNNIYLYLDQLVGHSLGSWSVTTSYVFVVISLAMLFYLIVKKNRNDNLLTVFEKVFSILIVLGTTVLIFTSLYLQWTELHAPIVDGVQGRYFIPLLPIIALLFMTKEKDEEINLYPILISFMFNIVSIVAIYKVYL